MQILADRLKEQRINKQLSQRAMATALDMALTTWQHYETGMRNPTADILLRIADFFDVSIDYLVGRTDNPNVNK